MTKHKSEDYKLPVVKYYLNNDVSLYASFDRMLLDMAISICHEYIIFNYQNIILFFCKNVYDDNINHSNKLNTKIKDMSYNNQNSINFIIYALLYISLYNTITFENNRIIISDNNNRIWFNAKHICLS